MRAYDWNMSKRSLSPCRMEIGKEKRQKSGQQDQNGHEAALYSPSSSLTRPFLYAAQEQACRDSQTLPLTRHHFARCGIQRSIAMVLSLDGFESASPESLESFTEMVETYLGSIIEEIKGLAIASRRDNPIPLDFEIIMKRYSIPLSGLKPHTRTPLPVRKLSPIYDEASFVGGDVFNSLPLLGNELSGQSDKDMKRYIPESFPSFPSTHTYKFTPQQDTRVRDSQRIREEAARTSQQGEDALRRLVRASKMRKQKEVKSLVERDSQGKERFRLWELTMKRFTDSDGLGEHAGRVEIADHSMIVNGDAMFSRQEVSRLSKRASILPNHTM